MTLKLTLNPSPEAAPEPLARHDFPVQGMTCAGCVGRVERALSKLPGVHEVRVNLATQQASVRYEPALAGPQTLSEAVEAAGYLVPAFARKAPGEQPLSPTERAEALAASEQRIEASLRRDLALAALFTAPLLVLAMSHGALDGDLSRALQLVLATPVMFGPGRRFLRLAWSAARQRAADMNTLVSLGALAAYGYSTLAVLRPSLFSHDAHANMGPPLYFEAGAAIVSFVLLGKLLETRAKKRLSAAVSGLGALLPQTATRVVSGNRKRFEAVELSSIVRGDLLLVRAGERVPNDGEVVEGSGSVDESMLSGESLPVAKAEHARVFGGSLLREGALTLKVTETGADTVIARIVEAVEQAQGSRAPVARLADRISGYFVPVVLLIAAITFAVWLSIDASSAGLAFAIERFVSVLVIACPCALGLATPAAVAVATGRAAELGVLFKGGAALEAASQLQTLLFDKTGTLTEGKPQLTDVLPTAGRTEAELLALAAAVEQRSEHPIARALVAAAEQRALVLPASEQFSAQPGAGAEAVVAAQRVRVGSASWLLQSGVDVSPLQAEAARLGALGRTPFFVAIDGALAGLVAVADRPAAHVPALLRALEKAGYSLAMVSGDREATARAIASELGLTQVFAEVLPEGKAELVRAQQRLARVAMIGDGINDAPALAAADVGIAVGGGTDVALATADIVLMRDGIAGLPLALGLARATMRTIRQNLFWAFVYNLVGIPLAAGALFPLTGWLLSPVFASAAMSLSSVSVLLSSLRLYRYRQEGSTP